MPNKKNIFKLVKEITKKAKTEESMGTGLIGEQLIISAYKTMEIDKLIKLRFIMNKIIKNKKEENRIKNAVNNSNNNECSNIDNNI